MMILRPNGEMAKAISDNTFFNQTPIGTLLEDHLEIDTTQWSFVVFSPKRVADLFFKLKKESITPSIAEAYAHELGIIEICKGDYANPTWVSLTPGLDIEKIRKDWALECFEKHQNSPGGHIQ